MVSPRYCVFHRCFPLAPRSTWHRAAVFPVQIANGNYPSSEPYAGAIHAKFVQIIVNGHALPFMCSSVSNSRSLRVLTLGTVEGRKLCVNHDLTCAGDGYRSSVNDDTDFSAVPPSELGLVFGDVCRRLLCLCQRYGAVALVVLYRFVVKDAFRQIPVDPLHVARFGYVFGEYAVVEFIL